MEDLKNIVETINNSDNWLDCLPECEKLVVQNSEVGLFTWFDF